MGGAALLTSDLFRLPTLLDQDTQDKLGRKRWLAAKDPTELTGAERIELQKLDDELQRLGFNYEFRDPLYSEFLKAWAEASQRQTEPMRTKLTKKEQAAQAKLVRRIVAGMKSRKGG